MAAVFSAVKTEYPEDVSSSIHVGSSFGESVLNGTAAVNGSHPSDMDEEDEIVREIDVFISPALSQQLHLIQYPLTPSAAADAPKGTTRYNPIAARYKPRNQMLELDFVVNHDSFATQKRPNGIPYGFDLKQRTYGSTSIDLVTHTALGILSPKGESLHLIPLVHPTKQMRPSFQHIDDINADRTEDSSSSNAKEARKHNTHSADEESDGMGEQPILLQKKESDKTIAIRQSSYAYKKALQAAEQWIDLQVHTDRLHRNAVQNKRREAYCSNLTRNLRLAPGVATPKAYISTLNYLPVSLEDVDRISSTVLAAAQPSSPGSEEEGLHHTDEEQQNLLLRELTARLTTTLQRGLPIPLSMIEHRYPDIDSRLLLTALLGCAVLVRGNFIIKSSLWGLSPVEQDARDAIIWILNRYGHVQRYRLLPWIAAAPSDSAEEEPNLTDTSYFDIAESTQQPTQLKEESINHIVMSMCRKVEKGWECRLEDDDTLAARFPLVAVTYGNYWSFRQHGIQKYLDLYEQNKETSDVLV